LKGLQSVVKEQRRLQKFAIFISHHFTMKRIIFFAFIAAFAYAPSFSQSDTTVKYYAKNGKETTKDSAISYVKFFRQASLWHGMEYYTKRNILKSEGDYNETNLQTAVGSVNIYKEDGKLDYTVEYADGKPLNKTYFYKSGDKKSYTVYSDQGIQLQKGWDETGKELKNFVVEREAQFKGGNEGWKKYLEKNLNATIPQAVGAPAGKYEVQVQFVVDKDGIPVNLKALSVPAKCKACGAEALRVLRESPKWEPAILNNEPVIYEVSQTISFQPVEGVKKG
jgi:antitoxin component YwqK of YwqJK toxin-antitoxin module